MGEKDQDCEVRDEILGLTGLGLKESRILGGWGSREFGLRVNSNSKPQGSLRLRGTWGVDPYNGHSLKSLRGGFPKNMGTILGVSLNPILGNYQCTPLVVLHSSLSP